MKKFKKFVITIAYYILHNENFWKASRKLPEA